MIIETKRLILRTFDKDDINQVFEYVNLQTVHCFEDMHFSLLEQGEKEIDDRIKDNEFYFAIVLKENNKIIGEVFAHPESTTPSEEDLDTYSPCWMLHPRYQGYGYAYEAISAYYDYLFNQKNARRIYAYTEDNNFNSQKLCEKLGMRKEGLFKEFVTFVNNPDGTPLYENTIQYAILKKEWEQMQLTSSYKYIYK